MKERAAQIIFYTLTLAIAASIVLFGRKILAQDQSVDQEQLPKTILTAIPPRTEILKAKTGETLQTKIKIKNASSENHHVSTAAKDYIIGEDGKTPVQVSEENAKSIRWSLAKWMTIAPNETELSPNETAQVNVVIEVPKDALPGGHYAMILHTPISNSEVKEKAARPKQQQEKTTQEEQRETVAAIQQNVGTLVYLIVEGDIKENAFIRNFKAPAWVELGPVKFSYDLENESDVHITPQSSITVKNMFGKVVETVSVPPQNVFPYNKLHFEASSEKIWGFGPYTAFLTAAYGSTGKTTSAILTYWMIPYKLILAALVIFFSLVAICIAIRRHILHKNDVKTQHIEVLEERIHELEKEVRRQNNEK